MTSSFPSFHFSANLANIKTSEHTETHTRTNTERFMGITTTTTMTNTKTTITGKDGYLLGLATNKGVFFAKYNGKTCVILGKDGVSRCVHKEFSEKSTTKKVLNLFAARGLGLLDTIQFTISAPFFLAAHGITFFGSSIGTIVILPALWLPSPKGKLIWKTCALTSLGNLKSLATVSATLVLTPIEIVAPEFNVKVLKMQKWGKKFPESEGRRA